MNNRRYKTDPNKLLEQGKAIMTSSEESRFLFRVFAVNMVLSGCTASQIGELAGLSKATVTGWVKTADEQGFDALRSQQRSGRPSKLPKEKIQQIDALLQTDPKEHGYKVWDGPTLAAYIKNTFGVELSVRQCQRMFHNLGYSLIRPQPYPSKGYEDSEERENFKKNARQSSQTNH